MARVKLSLAIASLAFQTALAFWPPTARIGDTSIVGQTLNFSGIPIHQYLGIPYAEPPVNELRYRKPVPITDYPEIVNATESGPDCKQYLHSWFPWVIRGRTRDEDCLYLNVWTPVGANRWNKKAVLYWIHGGEHRAGSGYYSWTSGYRIAALGNIIVVTVNYRLSYFGFFTSNTEDAPGNLAVWDILEGLKWVNRHIGAFGGDTSRITIGGQGSGAIQVGLLSASPLSRGLYARQIMQSGSPAYRRADNNTQNVMNSEKLADLLGCSRNNVTIYTSPKEVVECMKFLQYEDRSTDTIEILDAETSRYQSYHLIPQFGDEILEGNPRVSVINNDFRCTDLLIGTNEDEGAYSLTGVEYQFQGYDDFLSADPYVNRSAGEAVIRNTVSIFPDPEAIVDFYLPQDLQDDSDHRIRHQVYTAYGDTVMSCPTVYYAEQCAAQSKNVYFYHFTHDSTRSPWVYYLPDSSWLLNRSTHFVEMPYVLGAPFGSEQPIGEKILSNQIVDVWSNFVKYGNPGVPWPLYSRENPDFKFLGPDYVTRANGRGPHAENCEFLRPHFGF